MACWLGFSFWILKPGHSQLQAMTFGLAWLGLCGLAWLGFWPEAKPWTTLIVVWAVTSSVEIIMSQIKIVEKFIVIFCLYQNFQKGVLLKGWWPLRRQPILMNICHGIFYCDNSMYNLYALGPYVITYKNQRPTGFLSPYSLVSHSPNVH